MMGKQTGRLMILIVTVTMLLPVPSGHAGFWKEFALALTGAEIGSGYEEDWDGPAPFTDEHSQLFPGQCASCHRSEETASAEDVRNDVERICAGCHSLSWYPSHPIYVFPSMNVPSDFPLDAAGKMTCTTCHDPHGAGRNYLRGGNFETQQLKPFCQNCHDQAGGGHAGTIGVVHQKHETPRITSDQIDHISRNCMECHNGENGPDAPISITGDGSFMWAGPGGGSHKIGRNFQEALANSGAKLSLRENVPMESSFYEGKMGCLSCHNLYSTNSYKTTIAVRNSALCLSCHDK
jgi:predicted CXXCH cytochrome family protein